VSLSPTTRRRLIVVSNRGPLSHARDDAGERVVLRGGGGLVTALRGLIAHHDVTWIASAMSDEDRAVAAEHDGEAVEHELNGSAYRLRLVAHDPVAYDRFYNVVANGALWFVQHYLWSLATEPDIGPAFRTAWTEGYEHVNRAFADAVVSELERDPGADVCFHDYHLYLAPAFVRERRPDARLAHFVHVPWAQADYWHVLPAEVRLAIHEGLCANDVVGFHTDRWRRDFLESCARLAGGECDHEQGSIVRDGVTTHVVAHPIGIDPDEFDALKELPEVLEHERRIAESRPELLVVRVDRTDPSKNVVRGFRAFALLLERHPELVGRVGMLALLDPSRQHLPEYAEYLGAIERETRAVNDRYGTGDRLPVDLRIGDDFPQSVAAYKQFDVLLVNPIFDGMNLVAKEAPFVNERDGVLVLSENAGAHEELGEWALTVNPFDIEGQAEALYEALTMPAEERRRRRQAIEDHVREHDVESWSRAQLADLDRFAHALASEA
jgi:trehalose 6-phosphate synthase